MKANELMIGDWVKQKHSGLLLMVCAVNPPYINAESEDGQFLEDTIEPIPLTEEILKANGYEEHVGEKGAYGVTIAPHFKRDDSPEVFCDGHPFAVLFDEPVDIKYVHQLQHVLRLYGAEKEIKIKED
jgi:hypothetical protein